MKKRFAVVFLAVVVLSARAEMLLVDDGTQVLGWLPGVTERLVVYIRAGEASSLLVTDRNGIFVYAYAGKTNAPRVTFSAGGEKRTIRLTPAPATKPVAFLVPDRTAYRRGSAMRFAGFLRQKNDSGTYTPVVDREIEVEIRSTTRGILAGSAVCTADERGRFGGLYTFSEGDPLDDYTLMVKGYAGTTKVKLADFRKSKVKVKVDSAHADGVLTLSVSGVDFSNKQIPITTAAITVEVVEKRSVPLLKGLTLSDFCRSSQPGLQLEAMTQAERLLLDAGSLVVAGDAEDLRVMQTRSYTPEISADGSAVVEVETDPSWIRQGVSVRVSSVLTDANGREQRGTSSIPLWQKDVELDAVLSQHSCRAGETVIVTVRSATRNAVLMIYRLRRKASSAAVNAYPFYNQRFSSSHMAWSQRQYYASVVPEETGYTKTLVKAIPVMKGAATFTPRQHGAYELTVMGETAQGKCVSTTEGLSVTAATAESIRLELRSVTLSDQAPLSFRVHNADTVLAVIRDSSGIRSTKLLSGLASGVEQTLPLPPDCTYGGMLTVYVDTGTGIQSATREFRVNRTGRRLDVGIAVPERVKPGAEIEAVITVPGATGGDVIVAVYDESLHGIAPARVPDMVSFFYADARCAALAAQAELRRRLHGITFADLVAAVEKERGTTPGWQGHARGDWRWRLKHNRQLNGEGAMRALKIMGIKGIVADRSYQHMVAWQSNGAHLKQDAADVLLKASGLHVPVQVGMVNGTVILSASAEGTQSPYGWSPYARHRGRARRARGDVMISANAMVSAQSFLSVMPVSGVPGLELGSEGGSILRRDFSDSAYFSGTVQLNRDGAARVPFTLPDSLTNWRVAAWVVDDAMRLGSGTARCRSERPVMVWPMLPLSFHEGDTVNVFAMVHNRSKSAQAMATGLKVENGSVLGNAVQTVRVPAGESRRVYWSFVAGRSGFTELLMSTTCRAGSDASLKRLPVHPCRARTAVAASGRASGRKSFRIPADVDLTTATVELKLVPSMALDMVDSVRYLVGYPHGCVEQTMSRFLPVIKVVQALDRINIPVPAEIRAKLPEYSRAGINRLLALQKEDGGWGWQGKGKSHEMMTPYALYGLLEAEAAGYPSRNPEAVEMGLKKLRQFIDSMGDGQRADRMYCMYVYSLKHDLKPSDWQWIEHTADSGKTSHYALALALEMTVREKGSATLAAGIRDLLAGEASRFLGRISWKTAGFSRWGDNRNEVTAAVLKSLVMNNPKDPLIPGVLSFLSYAKTGNKWTSTKDTAMILFALCDYYAQFNEVSDGKQMVNVQLNDGTARQVMLKTSGIVALTFDAKTLRHGRNRLSFSGASAATMYRLVVTGTREGRAIKPENHGIEVTRRMWLLDPETMGRGAEIKDGGTVPVGSYLSVEVRVKTEEDVVARYLLAAAPKASGCQIVPATDMRFSRWQSHNASLREDKQNELLLHFEEMRRHSTPRHVLFAELTGEFVIPPAYAELMYQPDVRGNSGMMHIKIAAKADDTP
jgi:uncharacterized protein YfaS (alpha-2-macroglobulin family)